MIDTETQIESLDDRIKALISEGVVDPLVISTAILSDADEEWLAMALLPYAGEIIRHRVSQLRGWSLMTARAEGEEDTPEAAPMQSWKKRLAASTWIPTGDGGTWKPIKECTADDCLAKARWHRGLAKANIAQAERFERYAKMIKRRKVLTVGDLDEVEAAAA